MYETNRYHRRIVVYLRPKDKETLGYWANEFLKSDDCRNIKQVRDAKRHLDGLWGGKYKNAVSGMIFNRDRDCLV